MTRFYRAFVLTGWLAFCAALFCGCATSVPHGLYVAKRGLKAVDLATEEVVDEYAATAAEVRDYCRKLQPPHDEECLATRGVSDEDVAKSLAAAKQLAAAYDAAAEALAEMSAAWEQLAPELERLK